MKNLFLVLLFANIALFPWSYNKQNEMQERASQISPDVQSLALLHEAPQPGLPTIPEPAEMMENSSPAEISASYEAASDKQEESKIASQESVVDVSNDVETIITEESVIEAPGAEPRQENFCFISGPILDEKRVIDIEKSLLEQGYNYRREQTTVDEQNGFWVLVPPSAGRSEALEVVNELKRQGLTDVRRFTEGEFKNSVSLGLFSRKEFAERQSSRVRKKGFQTEIRPRIRQKEASILHVESIDEHFLDGDEWVQISTDYPGLKLQTVSCDDE